MSRSLVNRSIYIRVTEDGKRKWLRIGSLNRNLQFKLDKGIPLTGIFEVDSGYEE